jgi:hypothetical protein
VPELDQDREKREEIEAWFRERRIGLRYHQVGSREDAEWVALMIPDDQPFGEIERGSGPTKLAAAEDAKARRMAAEGSHQRQTIGTAVETDEAMPITPVTIIPDRLEHERAIGTPTVTAGPPPETVEPKKLERIAGTYGVHTYYVPLTGGTWWVRVEDEGGAELYWGLAEDWDDAKLASIIDLEEPPKADAD